MVNSHLLLHSRIYITPLFGSDGAEKSAINISMLAMYNYTRNHRPFGDTDDLSYSVTGKHYFCSVLQLDEK